MHKGGDGRKDRRKDRHQEIPLCVPQDIGPLGPLLKKEEKKVRTFLKAYMNVKTNACRRI